MKVLKKYSGILLAMTIVLTGCVMIGSDINAPDFGNITTRITGSGRTVIINKDFSDFSKIDISHGFNGKIIRSEAFSVTIEIDDNLLEYLDCSQSGNEIFVGMEQGHNYDTKNLRVTIETPDAERITLSGGCIMDFTNFNLDHDILFDMSGGSYVTGKFTAQNVKLNLSGGSVVNFNGGCGRLDINGSGGSILNLLDFPVENCYVDLSGGSILSLFVTKILELDLSGGSILKYKGNPDIRKINLSGGSVFQKLN